ncbi:hypothetical protein PPERSA_10919 [Pseudocohnilembus persalinus]|uniref:Uncharacterized protein n=1 Tax=Pseudocohnilembus persalinus TaxID=266149 RepID=A0A0V0R9T4_PSEPJ|nr:hypothetical protein PPERSA_10919 [Pseudocohnilembus persalinus]|eukprot:KRX11152.1 hypothetical protein PPERSA_10919 [Pseudocohnilembus persalinus]
MSQLQKQNDTLSQDEDREQNKLIDQVRSIHSELINLKPIKPLNTINSLYTKISSPKSNKSCSKVTTVQNNDNNSFKQFLTPQKKNSIFFNFSKQNECNLSQNQTEQNDLNQQNKIKKSAVNQDQKIYIDENDQDQQRNQRLRKITQSKKLPTLRTLKNIIKTDKNEIDDTCKHANLSQDPHHKINTQNAINSPYTITVKNENDESLLNINTLQQDKNVYNKKNESFSSLYLYYCQNNTEPNDIQQHARKQKSFRIRNKSHVFEKVGDKKQVSQDLKNCREISQIRNSKLIQQEKSLGNNQSIQLINKLPLKSSQNKNLYPQINEIFEPSLDQNSNYNKIPSLSQIAQQPNQDISQNISSFGSFNNINIPSKSSRNISTDRVKSNHLFLQISNIKIHASSNKSPNLQPQQKSKSTMRSSITSLLNCSNENNNQIQSTDNLKNFEFNTQPDFSPIIMNKNNEQNQQQNNFSYFFNNYDQNQNQYFKGRMLKNKKDVLTSRKASFKPHKQIYNSSQNKTNK